MEKQHKSNPLEQETKDRQTHPAPVREMQPLAVITGTEGDDHLQGTLLPDTINGLGGDDFIEGRWEADRIDGGNGYDIALYNRSVNETSLKAEVTEEKLRVTN